MIDFVFYVNQAPVCLFDGLIPRVKLGQGRRSLRAQSDEICHNAA